jgi:chromosome partitioning protein
VGKTTTAVNLAAALTAIGQTVLLIDFDPQGNASTGLGVKPNERRNGSYRLITSGETAANLVTPTDVPNLFLIPAEADLAGAEIELVEVERREFRLRSALAGVTNSASYDYVLIDCPPSLGLLTLNALVASAGIIVPLQCEFYALEGISGLVRTIESVRRRLNPDARLLGIVLTMFDSRNSLSSLVASDARDFFGDWVYQTVIPRNVRISEASSYGKPILSYDPRSSGAKAYNQLATELLDREKQG